MGASAEPAGDSLSLNAHGAGASVPTAHPLGAIRDDSMMLAAFLYRRPRLTREVYEYELRRFREITNHFPLRALKFSDLQSYMSELEGRGLSKSSLARASAVIKSFFSFGHALGYFRADLGVLLRGYKPERRVHERYVEPALIAQMIEGESNARNRIILWLLYVAGLRASELASLNVGSLSTRQRDGVLTVIGKRDKVRAVSIPEDLTAELLKLGEGASDPSRPLFLSCRGVRLTRQDVWRIVKSAATRAGLPPEFSPHWARHAHVSHAIENGAPLPLVQQTVGHASLATTGQYASSRPGTSSGHYLGHGNAIERTPEKV